MLVYIYDREEEFHENQEYAYVYQYDDNYEYEEDTKQESPDYEIDYEVTEDSYLVP
ncbi:MAG: hypothetical protein ACI9TV_000667 [Sulfurimonas sp.]|jgi:hypothetical protein|uniref:hypothetical protein n=1 Tax=Sulfurimonas sp. TaxID=2022749 RepID=UPI0039E33729